MKLLLDSFRKGCIILYWSVHKTWKMINDQSLYNFIFYYLLILHSPSHFSNLLIFALGIQKENKETLSKDSEILLRYFSNGKLPPFPSNQLWHLLRTNQLFLFKQCQTRVWCSNNIINFSYNHIFIITQEWCKWFKWQVGMLLLSDLSSLINQHILLCVSSTSI